MPNISSDTLSDRRQVPYRAGSASAAGAVAGARAGGAVTVDSSAQSSLKSGLSNTVLALDPVGSCSRDGIVMYRPPDRNDWDEDVPGRHGDWKSEASRLGVW